MAKTFTLSTDLQTEVDAISEQDYCDLLFDTSLLHFLIQELETIDLSPRQSTVDCVLAYSKAVEVKQSATMVDGHKVMMN